MLYITTETIKYSTVGASFTVSFSVAPDEIYALMRLHDKFTKYNGKAFPLTANIAEQPEPYEYEIKALHKDYVEPYVVIEQTEPQTDCPWK